MVYKGIKAMIRSPEEGIDFLDFVTGVLQEDIYAPFRFIICLNYILWIGLLLEKLISRYNPAETITDAVYADDLALLANTSTQTETLRHSLVLTRREFR